MQQHNLTQGSPEWHAHRAQCWNASDAPAMMGCSPYETRAELIRRIATGITPEVDAATQRRFDEGHRFEAMARPQAEDIVGDDLSPLSGSVDAGLSRPLAASFDGITFMGDTVFEHKTLNDSLRYTPWDQGNGAHLPLHFRVQMEHQLIVSGAERALFMATRWEGEQCVEHRHCWYASDAGLRAQILAGWAQLEKDVAAYAPQVAAEPAPAGRAPDTLPALRIEVTGAVTASNLAEFKATALAAIRSVNRDLQTDQDFADAEKAVKWFAEVESRLKAAKEHALSQTADIDALFKTMDDIAEEARRGRLDLEKLVTRRKVEVKEVELMRARDALALHVHAANAEIAPAVLSYVAPFGDSIKGLRTIDSVRAKLGATLAAAKIHVDARARDIRANLVAFKTAIGDDRTLHALFADLGTLAHKAPDDFVAVLDQRITKHRADEAAREAKRKADEAARIAAAEQRAREQEAARIAEEQRKKAAEEAAQHAATLQAAQTIAEKLPGAVAAGAIEPERAERIGGLVARLTADAVIEHAMKEVPGNFGPPAVMNVCGPAHIAPQPAAGLAFDARGVLAPATTPASRADEPATLKLGVICERLGFGVSAAFLANVLHIPAAGRDRSAVLYRESQWPVICRQLQAHIGAMAELHARRAA